MESRFDEDFDQADASCSALISSQAASLASGEGVSWMEEFGGNMERACPARSLTNRVGKGTEAPRHLC